ncbi:MAG: histidine phosphatase family protein [Novosphingobium sp.]
MTDEAEDRTFAGATGAQRRFALAPGMRQIILVRHGSSVGATVDTIELGPLSISDPVLSLDGEVQAQAVGAALARTAISAVFVTPLRRTRQTAAPLVQATGLQPQVIDDLREVHMGDFEHTFYEHAHARNPLIARMFAEERWDVIPNAEPVDDFAERVRRGMAHLLDGVGEGETSVLFSHAGTIAEICRQATQSRRFAFTGVENASISRLLVNPDGSWKLRTFNEVAHL